MKMTMTMMMKMKRLVSGDDEVSLVRSVGAKSQRSRAPTVDVDTRVTGEAVLSSHRHINTQSLAHLGPGDIARASGREDMSLDT